MNPLNQKAVLILEEDETQREVLSEGFEFHGAIVRGAIDAQSALEILKNNRVDVLFANLNRMGGDGLALLRAMAPLPKKPFIFVYTASSDYSPQALKSFGVLEVFRMPLQTDRILKSVQDVLTLKQSTSIPKPPAPESKAQAAPSARAGSLEKVSFLVLQDQMSDIEKVSQMIGTEFPNATILGALNPKDGIQKMSRQKFDLVVSDLHLGKFNGINFIRAATTLENQTSDLKFVLTADEQPFEMASLGNRVVFCKKPLVVDDFLKSVRGLIVVKAIPGTQTYKVDVEFINPFIESTLRVFDEMLNIHPVKDLIYIRKPDQVSGDVSAVVEMNSDQFLGSMAISFDEGSFLEAVSTMLGKPYSVVTDEIKNAAAEICNQIFGYAKRALNDKGHAILPAIPRVITGKNHRVEHSAKGICIVVKFVTAKGSFAIEAVIQPK